MEGYSTVKAYAQTRLTEKKSVFIADVLPVSEESGALEFISSVRKKYSDARHVVYAYRLRVNNLSRFSDDGEPHGTAGMPIFDLLRNGGLYDTAVTVTRYFGGILLGTGGLVRTYTAAAKSALDEAGTAFIQRLAVFELSLSYPDYQKVDFYLGSVSACREAPVFGGEVTLKISVPFEDAADFVSSITDLTAGKAGIKSLGESFGAI